jgi:hypothetical protein
MSLVTVAGSLLGLAPIISAGGGLSGLAAAYPGWRRLLGGYEGFHWLGAGDE